MNCASSVVMAIYISNHRSSIPIIILFVIGLVTLFNNILGLMAALHESQAFLRLNAAINFLLFATVYSPILGYLSLKLASWIDKIEARKIDYQF